VFITNHVLSGAVIGRLAGGRPVTAFAAGLASHLVLDAVPHWGCDLREPGRAERFLVVAKRDGVLGLTTMAVIALTTERTVRTATFAAVAGAVLLDLDKPCVHFFGRDPFPYAVRLLHRRVQNESASGLPNEIGSGILLAALDAFAAAMARRPKSRDPQPRPQPGAS